MKSADRGKTSGMGTFLASKMGMTALSVLAVALILGGTLVLLMSGNREPTSEPPHMTWSEFIGHYDTDGDGFVDEYAPNGFRPGKDVVIEDVAVEVEYYEEKGYSIISCSSTYSYGTRDIPLIAYENMESLKGKKFKYRMTFWEYDRYSSMSGHRIEVLPKELAEIIEPNIRVSFAVYKVSEGNWSIQASPDEPVPPGIIKYVVRDINGTTVFGSAFPRISGLTDSNGVRWDDTNQNGLLDTGDRIEIHNANTSSDHVFSIIYGVSGSAPLP